MAYVSLSYFRVMYTGSLYNWDCAVRGYGTLVSSLWPSWPVLGLDYFSWFKQILDTSLKCWFLLIACVIAARKNWPYFFTFYGPYCTFPRIFSCFSQHVCNEQINVVKVVLMVCADFVLFLLERYTTPWYWRC